MKTRLVRIGNSRGIRIPKPLLEQVGLADEVELTVADGGLVIRSSPSDRPGWNEAARLLAARNETELLDELTPTRFDEAEWEWD